MKKLFLLFAVLISISVFGQNERPPGYVQYRSKVVYDAIKAGYVLQIPKFCGFPALLSWEQSWGQRIAVDTCNDKFYFYDGSQWRYLTDSSYIVTATPTLQQVVDAGNGLANNSISVDGFNAGYIKFHQNDDGHGMEGGIGFLKMVDETDGNGITLNWDAITGGAAKTWSFPDAASTFAGTSISNAWSDGVKQTFNPDGTNAGINVGSHTADPSSPANGDMFYNSTSNELKARINGAWVALGAGGGSGITVGSTAITSGTDKAVPFNDAGVYGEDASNFYYDKAENELTVGDGTFATAGSYTLNVSATGTENAAAFNAPGGQYSLVLGNNGYSSMLLVYNATGRHSVQGYNQSLAVGASAGNQLKLWGDNVYIGTSDDPAGSNFFRFSSAGGLSIGSGVVGTDAGAGGLLMGGRLKQAKGANVASANDLTLGTDGNTFHITGTTQINAITTANWQSGSIITLIFDSTPTVKNNTAGGAGTAVMLLAGAADFSATANDVLRLVYDGTSWFEVSRSVN